MAVKYVYKGTFKESDTITVSLPGGKLMFDDSTTAEIRAPWFKMMTNGATYALFLTSQEKGRPYITTCEAQGLFEIPTATGGGKGVKVHSGVLNDPVWKYQNMEVSAFLKELRRVTGRRKDS